MAEHANEEWNPGTRWFTNDEIDRAAAKWMASLNSKQYVGARHHIVPRFILAKFANSRGQVYVRDRMKVTGGLRNVRDLAVRDFYTFIDRRGELDSSYESLLGEIEKAASEVLRAHLANPFARPRPFDEVERMAVDSLVSMQAIRGHSHRRVGEIMADYYVKVTNQHRLSARDLTEFEFVPHQNELLTNSMQLGSRIHHHLTTRPCFLVTLDRPLLVTCDEPVLLDHDDDDQVPSSGPGLSDHPRNVTVNGVPPEDLIQFTRTSGKGFADAAAIAMPVGPRHAVVYDRVGAPRPAHHLTLTGAEADRFADGVFEYAVDNAYSWVAAHPDHPAIRTRMFPAAKPPIRIIDGNTPMSQRRRSETRRTAHRLNKAARPHPLGTEAGTDCARRC